MKPIIFLLSIVWGSILYAQTLSPQAINYQSIIRDPSGTLMADHLVSLQITLLDSGMAIYRERWENQMTNQFGLLSLPIGLGIPQVVSGTASNFSKVNWGSGPLFVKIEVDPNAGTAYKDMGTSPIRYAPIAIGAIKLLPSYQGDSSFIIPKTTTTATLHDTWIWEENDHLYALFTTSSPITWLDAQELARKVKGHLVTITSEEENQFVLNNILSLPEGSVFIPLGYTDAIQEGIWQWVTGEIGIASPEVPFSFWFPGEPNNSNGENVGMIMQAPQDATRKWNDVGATSIFFDSVIIEFDYSRRP